MKPLTQFEKMRANREKLRRRTMSEAILQSLLKGQGAVLGGGFVYADGSEAKEMQFPKQ